VMFDHSPFKRYFQAYECNKVKADCTLIEIAENYSTVQLILMDMISKSDFCVYKYADIFFILNAPKTNNKSDI
jgi:hypothetical protein